MKEKFTECINKIAEEYGLVVFEDPDILSQFMDSFNPDGKEANFRFVQSVRLLLKDGWKPAMPISDEKAEEYRRLISSELGYNEEETAFVMSLILVIFELEDEELFVDGNGETVPFYASPGNLEKISGGIGNKPTTMWLRKKVISNSAIYVISLVIIAILFLQIGMQRDPVGNEYRIAFFDTLSGVDSSQGYNRLRAAQLAIEKINSQNAERGYKFTIIGFDTPSDPVLAGEYVKNVMKDKTLLVMASGMKHPVVSRLAEVADEIETPLVITTADTVPGMNKKDNRPHLYSFSLASNSDVRAKKLAYFIVQGLKRKKIAVLYCTNDSFYKQEHDSFLRWMKVLGGAINSDLAFDPANKKSHPMLIEAVKGNDSDLLVIIASDEAKDKIIGIARESGYTGAIVSENYRTTSSSELLASYKNSWWLNEVTTLDPRVSSLMRDYKNMYNESCPQSDVKSAVLTHDGIYLLAYSIYQSHGYRGESVRHALLSTSELFLTHCKITMDPRTHEPSDKPVYLIYCDGGRGSLQKRIDLKNKK